MSRNIPRMVGPSGTVVCEHCSTRGRCLFSVLNMPQHERLRTLIRERALNTAMLASVALVLATAIGLPLGVYSGSRRGGLGRSAVRAISP